MKKVLLFVFILSFVACLPSHKKSEEGQKLSLKRLTQSPSLSGQLPKSLRFSPDGSKISFLKGKAKNYKVQDLWYFDLESETSKLLVDSASLLKFQKEVLSDEEKARRERKRIHSSGIVEYKWSYQGDKILFPINGDLYLYTLNKVNPVTRLTKTKDYELDPRFSPNGNYVSFVKNHNVYVIDLKTLNVKQVTFSGTKIKPMGTAEFVAQEEMGRYRGYFWAPDEKHLAITAVDNSSIEETERFEIYSDQVKLVKQRYPYAGTENAKVELKIYRVKQAGQKQRAQTLPISLKDYYIPQIKWVNGAQKPLLSYTLQSRDQKKIDFIIFDVETKKAKKIFTEVDFAWTKIRHDHLFFEKGKKLLWVSDKSGHAHVHAYDLQSGKEQKLTVGNWDVRSLLSVDEKKQVFYILGTKDSVLENHLYQVSLKGDQKIKKITNRQGYHKIVMSKDAKHYIDYFSNEAQPTSVSFHDVEGQKNFFIFENKVDKTHPLFSYTKNFSKWSYKTYERPNAPTLHYKVLLPKNFEASKKYPVIQYVYGGPGVQLVKKAWGGTTELYHQILAQNGFIVIVGDNRGTPGRGREFERSYHLNFGVLEVEDQSALLKNYLKNNSFADPNRLGVYGHSYGGYLTLMLMMQKSDLYKVGVSGAPVVDWALYDTHYTERFIGMPLEQKEVYKRANVLTYADSLKGKLLVVHGMADDNVLYKNSLILYSALQEKEILFDMMAYPGAKHGIRAKKSWQQHYLKTSLQYFKDHL